MPIYQYKSTAEKPCDHCRNGFELMQSMKDKPLKKCPQCGAPVQKCITQVSGGVPKLSDGNLRDHGFTKFKKTGDGGYEKTT